MLPSTYRKNLLKGSDTKTKSSEFGCSPRASFLRQIPAASGPAAACQGSPLFQVCGAHLYQTPKAFEQAFRSGDDRLAPYISHPLGAIAHCFIPNTRLPWPCTGKHVTPHPLQNSTSAGVSETVLQGRRRSPGEDVGKCI